MASSQFDGLEETLNIKRGGGAEPCHGPPTSFTIIGLDITAEKLAARYPETTGKFAAAHERARKLILGTRDRTRAEDIDPPPEFVASIGAEGIVQRIVCANLGPDKSGKPWVLTVAGRKRNTGARIWNKAHPADAVEMLAEMRSFRDTGAIDAELAALDVNSASNIFVAMRPSQMADHAVMHAEKCRPPSVIALKIGAKNAEHVMLLLALAKCSQAVKDEVDADRLALAEVPGLAKVKPEEQERRAARKTAGKGKASKDAAAPPRAKTRPARVLESVEAEVRNAGKDAHGAEQIALFHFAEGMAFARGLPISERFAKYEESAEATRKAARS